LGESSRWTTRGALAIAQGDSDRKGPNIVLADFLTKWVSREVSYKLLERLPKPDEKGLKKSDGGGIEF